MYGQLFFRIVSIGMLILANGFFVAAELSLVSMRETRVERLIALGRPGARSVRRLQEDLEDFLPAVQLGVTLCSLALGWMGEPVVSAILGMWLKGVPHVEVYARVIAVPLGFAVITYLHVLLGELVPKSLALRKADQLAVAVAGPMLFFIRATRPLVRFMRVSASVVLRAFSMSAQLEKSVHSPEEIKLIATAARRTGMLPAYQELLIHRAVELDQVMVGDIMTPRQRVFSLPNTMAIEEASERIVEEQHSRIPIYDAARGQEFIVGVLYSKDVSRLMHFRGTASSHSGGSPFGRLQIGQVMRDAMLVPEARPVLDLLRDFQSRRRHLAIVIDEYGSTVGIVTVEDAIEQIVGEVEDEFDVSGAPLSNATGPVTLEGSIALRDLETQMQWKLPREAGEETLAGFLLTRLGRIPTGGETVEFEDRRLTVEQMNGHRISKVRVERIVPAGHPLAGSAQ